MMFPTAESSDVSKSRNATPRDHFALKPLVQPAPAPGVQTAPDAPLLPPGEASAPHDSDLTGSVHARLFGGPAARVWDNVTGGAYNFPENDALLRFRHENAPLLDALGGEFDDDQLMRIAGAVARVLQDAADHHGLSGIFGFHLLPTDTQNALLENMHDAMQREAARIRDEARPEAPGQQTQPGPSEQHRPEWDRFVVPNDGPSPMPDAPTLSDPVPPVTFNDPPPTTQTRRAPAPLDPETLAATQENAQLALELEGFQQGLQGEIGEIRRDHADVIAEGRGRHEQQRLEREFSSGIVPGPISDPDVLGALAQQVLERAKELTADGYPHYADALIRAFRERYPEFGGEADDQGASGAPGRVERELEGGSEFTTGESYGDSVAEEARRLREGGDPTGALELMAEYLRSHGAPMEGATGGADVARSASTAIMNELRNMPPYNLAQMVLEMGNDVDSIRPEYRDLIRELLLSLRNNAEPIRQALNVLHGAPIDSIRHERDLRTAPEQPPERDPREATLSSDEQEALEAIREFLEDAQRFASSPMMPPLSGQPWYGRMLMEAMRGINDFTPDGLIAIVGILEEEFGLDAVELNLLRELYTALMLVPEDHHTDAHDEAIRRVEEAMLNQGQPPFRIGR